MFLHRGEYFSIIPLILDVLKLSVRYSQKLSFGKSVSTETFHAVPKFSIISSNFLSIQVYFWKCAFLGGVGGHAPGLSVSICENFGPVFPFLKW